MTALNWQVLSFQFGGNGVSRTLAIRLEGGDGIATPRAVMMLDDLRIVETLPNGVADVYGLVGSSIALPRIKRTAENTATTERLSVELLGLVVGSVLSDGVRSLVVSGPEQDR
jgi:hypothetical protein